MRNAVCDKCKNNYPPPKANFCDSCELTFMLCGLCESTYTYRKPHHRKDHCPACNKSLEKGEPAVSSNFRQVSNM